MGCNHITPGIAAPKCALQSGPNRPAPVKWTLEVSCSEPGACQPGTKGSPVVLKTDPTTRISNCTVTLQNGVAKLAKECGAPSDDSYVCQNCPPLGTYHLAWTS